MTYKEELIRLLCRKSVQFSDTPDFRLVSGRMSRLYVNCKPTTLSPRGMFLAGHLMLEAVESADVKGIGGLTFGADPIAVATAFASELAGRPIHAFSIRKAPKDHGIVRWIEGDLAPGDRVVVIDDVATTGGSTIRAIERARSEGIAVVRAVVLVDREEGGLDNIRKEVPDATALILRSELLAVWSTQAAQGK